MRRERILPVLCAAALLLGALSGCTTVVVMGPGGTQAGTEETLPPASEEESSVPADTRETRPASEENTETAEPTEPEPVRVRTGLSITAELTDCVSAFPASEEAPAVPGV